MKNIYSIIVGRLHDVSALLTLYVGSPLVIGGSHKGPVMRSLDIYFVFSLLLNKQLR